jgi:SHS2 domain-containing protein
MSGHGAATGSHCYEEVEHTADLALRIRGRTVPELFANAAYAMFDRMANLERVPLTATRRLRVSGLDLEGLLVSWLNELLFLQETRHEIYREFTIHSFTMTSLQASVSGGPAQDQHTIIKGATFHNLAIEPTAEGYVTTVVFDV